MASPTGFWDKDISGRKEFRESLMNACLLQRDTKVNLDLIDEHDGMMAYETDGGRIFVSNGVVKELLRILPLGIDADKPAALAANNGKLFAATDTQTLYAVDSATLIKLATGSHANLDTIGENDHHAKVHDNDEHTTAVPVNIGTANAEGSSAATARADHVHDHVVALGVDLHHPQNHAAEHTNSAHPNGLPIDAANTIPSLRSIGTGKAAAFEHAHLPEENNSQANLKGYTSGDTNTFNNQEQTTSELVQVSTTVPALGGTPAGGDRANSITAFVTIGEKVGSGASHTITVRIYINGVLKASDSGFTGTQGDTAVVVVHYLDESPVATQTIEVRTISNSINDGYVIGAALHQVMLKAGAAV